MKKILALLAALALMMLAIPAFAAAPGDTVTVPIYVETSNAAYVKVRVTLSGGWGTITGLTSVYGAASSKTINGSGNPVVPSGKFGTATVKLNDNIAADTYTLTVTVSEAFDINENDASATAYSGSITVEKPACEHTFGAWTVTTPATCTEAGVETRECTKNCGEKETREIAATGHAYDDGVQTKAPTCAEMGEMTFTCETCGHSYTEEIAKSDKHTWDEGVITKPMSCLEDGVKTFTCTVCGLTDETVIPAPGKHTYDENDLKTDVEPTCTENGKGSFTCTACGEKIDGGVIPALGHDKKEAITAATCGKDGEKVTTCSRCDFKETEVIPATGEHTYGDWTESEAATCTEGGKETRKCNNCDATETRDTKALGHDKQETITAATCGKDGEKVTTCSRCDFKETEVIPATGEHTWDENKINVEKEPTCTEPGKGSYTCNVCGTKIEGGEIAALGHDKKETITAATCGKDGEKVTTCSRCDLNEVEVLPATGEHTYGEAVQTKAPTCTDKGEKTSTCSVCGDVKTEEVAALGHTEEVVPAVEPTCTETGLTEGKKCSVCGTELVKQKTVKAKGHKKGEWVVVKEPTEEEKGLKERYCTVCGELLESKTFTLSSVTYYPNNTACSMGPCFRDESKLTKKWFRFTPIDLSVEGEQTFDLIASNLYIIGQVKVTVAEGNVTVEVEYNSKNIVVHNEFCTFLPSLAETTTLDMAELKNYTFGEPISIENDLAGDTKVLLFICNEIDYNTGMNVILLPSKTKEFKQQIEDMKLLMD